MMGRVEVGLTVRILGKPAVAGYWTHQQVRTHFSLLLLCFYDSPNTRIQRYPPIHGHKQQAQKDSSFVDYLVQIFIIRLNTQGRCWEEVRGFFPLS